MKLIEDIHNWPKFWSVRLAILSAAFSATAVAYAALPADWLPGIPQAVKTTLGVGALLTAFGSAVARGVAQDALPGKKPS